MTDREKMALGGILREKIIDTHDTEYVINDELAQDDIGTMKEAVLKEALQHVRDTRDDCYNIAQKLNIK